MKIEKSKYQGYLWYSHKNEPDIIDNNVEFELEISNTDNPFIIEGQLYDGTKSISIKFVDGKYIKKEYIVPEVDKKYPKEYVQTKRYLANSRMFKDSKVTPLYCKQYWQPEKDQFCEDMYVLQPKEFVFVGFNG